MECIWCSSLEKVFADRRPDMTHCEASVLQNEVHSFQIAVKADEAELPPDRKLRITAKLQDGCFVSFRKVELVPSELAAYPDRSDDEYLTKSPGLFPDLLMEPKQEVTVTPGRWESIWVDLTFDRSGRFESVILLTNATGDSVGRVVDTVRVIPAFLPAQKLIHTEWLHYDCLAQYYQVPVFSEAHWKLIENYIGAAAENGMNMIYTPLFTPPLDTAVDGERLTVQLVDVTILPDEYRFGFDRLRRFVKLAERCGMKHFEMCHLFTQWGAKAAPKIVAVKNGREIKLFGWETDSAGEEYAAFLAAFLPALTNELTQLGIADRCYFHISDEPHAEHIDVYRKDCDAVKPFLKGYKIIDALSDIRYFREKLIEIPIAPTNKIAPFIEENADNLWCYYCCSQSKDVSNRFFALPSSRNRILGVQLFYYEVKGFLHWGYNFWNTRFSIQPIDPFLVTDAGGAFPSGDAFLVYPGADGRPLGSIRLAVLRQALYDLRALELLSSLTSRGHVKALIRELTGEEITFDKYPQSPDFFIQLRNLVNAEIEKHIK